MPYNPALDGLRAIAVLAVIIFHAKVPGLRGGFVGVDVFFVLSGFLITTLLVAEHRSSGEINLLRFYRRRFLRLTPALLLMLAVYLAAAPFLWPKVPLSSHFGDAALAAAYLSDYTQAFWGIPRFLVHTWSLSVEEHFYILWPLALLGILRLQRPNQIRALAGLYVAATAWRFYSCFTAGTFDEIYFRFDTRLSGLMLGALLAIVCERGVTSSPRTLMRLGATSALGLGVLILSAPWGLPIGLAVHVMAAEVAAAGLIVAVIASRDTPIHRILATGPFVTIGVLSYGLYLWHYPIAFALRDIVPWYWTITLTLPLSLLGAAVSYMTVERAGRALRDRLESRAAFRLRSREAEN
jgi:peptidoglycan/LPS O-acetylase OafA/YrhL